VVDARPAKTTGPGKAGLLEASRIVVNGRLGS
jgi:hypothetical protein